jgi:hypothetical protein
VAQLTEEPQGVVVDNPRVNDFVGRRLNALAAKAPLYIAIGAILTVAGLVPFAEIVFQSYLVAFMFWFGITLGSTAWLMGHHVVGGGWGYLLRRPFEAATRLWPIVLAMWDAARHCDVPFDERRTRGLYEWADTALVAGDKILYQKSGYLNPLAWLIRAGIYFTIWFGMAHLLNKYSRMEDESSDPIIRHRLSIWCSVGLLLYLLTITFASIDWVMTLEPHWFSSLWGVIFLVGQAHATLCVMMILVKKLAGDSPLLQKVEKRYFRDIGNLMLAFTMLWAYLNYSQFMIQYSGNIAEEAEWFVHRASYGWNIFGAVNIILHFAAPFLLLLMSINKTNLNNFVKLATFLVFARFVDLFFYVVPTFRESPLSGTPFYGMVPGLAPEGIGFAFLSDIGLPILLGGIWILCWARQMTKVNAPLVPVHDLRVQPFWPVEGTLPERGQEKGVNAHG